MRSNAGFVVAGLIGLVVGYFGGREHLKYEMRTAIQSAAEEMQKGFASAFSMDPPPKPAQASTASPPVPPKSPPPISAGFVRKGFVAADYKAGTYQDYITISVLFSNTTERDIRAFDGALRFTDLLDNPVLAASVAINDPIKAGATFEWSGQLDYNQFTDAHQRFRNEDAANLKLAFIPRKVLYGDGMTEEFE